jgi:tetratricopeptide (TPR) repeat protein
MFLLGKRDRGGMSRLVGVFLLSCCLLIVAIIWIIVPRDQRAALDEQKTPTASLAASSTSPLSAKYVGDDTCARCHPSVTRKYRQHPMAHSCTPISKVASQEGFEKGNPFQAGGFLFSIEPRGEKVFHKTVRLDSSQQPLGQSEVEVQFALGAGTRGRSYLINRDGLVFQSPISWYSERQVWDLSPHLGAAVDQLYRPVQPLCLFCHADHVDPIERSGNRYREPIFQSYGIGCERCHGPGELHAQRHKTRSPVPAEDEGIVNPGRLEPALREAVCQQCHLQGLARILRPARQVFDYRPGMPLPTFWSVFVKPPSLDNHKRFSSEVEQMYSSRCYNASQGKLGCISCHDPHEVPAPQEKEVYFRNRCLACHHESACALTQTVRRQRSPSDSCIDCHMKRTSSNLPHMASADHRILRNEEKLESAPHPSPTSQWLAELERSPEHALVLFHQKATDRDEVSRDFGVALMDLASLKMPTSVRRRLAEHALPLLTSSIKSRPDDAPARQGQGYALWLLDRSLEALTAMEAALDRAPEHEETLGYAAAIAAQMGRTETAIEYWQRSLRVNPWSARSHYELAKLLVQAGQWPNALIEAGEARALDPFHLENRLLLIECQLARGNRQGAQAEFEEVLRFNPADVDVLKRWFAERTR